MLMAFLIVFFSTAVGLLRSQVFLYLYRMLVDINAIDLIQCSHKWKNISRKPLHMASLQNLVSVKMSNKTDISTAMREAIEFYSTDLPNPSLLDERQSGQLFQWINTLKP